MSKHLILLSLFLAMPMLGCSSDSVPQVVLADLITPPPPPPPPPAPMPASDVAGTWFTNTVNNAVNCGLGEIIDAQAILITQDENDIELLTSTGNLILGTVSGDIIEWTGDISERGGTTTFTSVSLPQFATWQWSVGCVYGWCRVFYWRG